MLLVITHSKDATADYLCGIIAERGLPFVRFDTDQNLSDIKISYAEGCPRLMMRDATYAVGAFRHVWLRRPKPLEVHIGGDASEQAQAQKEWSEALEGFFAHIPFDAWMNHPSRNVTASHKMEQLTRASRFGLAIPDTLVTQHPEQLLAFWEQCDGEVVTKPLAEGYLYREGEAADTTIYTRQVQPYHLDHIDTLVHCPTLFQQRIEKQTDVRICIVDDEVHAVAMEATDDGTAQRLDIRRHNMVDVSYSDIALPENVGAALKKLIRSYELRFAAIDVTVDRHGTWIFFEINPNGQWAWLDLVAGTNIAEAFIRSFYAVE